MRTEDPRLLAHKRRVDEERKAAAIEAKRRRTIAAMHRVAR